jgi:zinc transporter
MDDAGPSGVSAAAGAARSATGAFLWVYAFVGGCAQALTGEAAPANLAPAEGWIWAHLPLSDQRARGFLEQFHEMPEAAREMILACETRVQVQFAGDWAYGVLPDVQRDPEGRGAGGPGRLYFALDARRLVTARRHALQGVDEVRRKVAAGIELESPAEAWIELVEGLIDLAERRLHALSEAIDRIEDRMLGDDEDLEALQLGPTRRELSRQHRELLVLRSALGRALAPRAAARMPALVDQIPRLSHEVEDLDREAGGLQERARLLNEEIDTRMAAGANRSMRTLTILSTLLIPPTLIVGAFGMNLPGMPFETGHAGFAKALLLCVAVVAGAYGLLRRWRIL